MKYIDTHAHIQFANYDDDRTDVIDRMRAEDVGAVVVGTNALMSAEALEATTLWPEALWAIVGMHPTEIAREEFETPHFRSLLQSDKVVGIGECGVDYFRRDKDSNEVKAQKRLFEQHVELAVLYDKPLMLHCRPSQGTMDAYEDVLAIVKHFAREHGERVRGNAHFFVGSTDIARQFLELGFTISFPGVITFTHDYDDVVQFVPRDRILSETDCPFAAPVPYRGKRNEPVYVKEVVKRIAALHGAEDDNDILEAVRKQLVENARRLFSL